MLTPVACFTCGLPIGDVAGIYHHIRRKRLRERYGATPDRAEVAAGVEMGDVLDALKITRCCRIRLSTAMLFSDHY